MYISDIGFHCSYLSERNIVNIPEAKLFLLNGCFINFYIKVNVVSIKLIEVYVKDYSHTYILYIL